MKASDKRKARTGRRFAAIGTILHIKWNLPLPDYALTAEQVMAELKPLRDGQRRKSGRPAKPNNSNNELIKALLTYDAKLAVGPLTRARLAGCLSYLKRPGLSAATLRKAIQRWRARKQAVSA